MAALSVPGPPMCIVSPKAPRLQRVPRGGETRPEAESDSTRVTLPGHAGTCRDPVLPGTSLARGLAPHFPEPWASAGRPARPLLCGACQEAGAANDLFFWAKGAIWSERPQLWNQNNKNKNSKDFWAAWIREPTAPGGAADSLESKQVGQESGGPHPAPCSDLRGGYLQAPTTHFPAAETKAQNDRVTFRGHTASEGPSQVGPSSVLQTQACSWGLHTAHLGGALVIHFTDERAALERGLCSQVTSSERPRQTTQ